MNKKGCNWTEEEKEYLKEHWGDEGGAVCRALPAHSPQAVRQKAKELGLTRTAGVGHRSPWSTEDMNFLHACYGVLPVKEIAEKLSRTEAGVLWKAKQMGLR